jgi:hypothetical protein
MPVTASGGFTTTTSWRTNYKTAPRFMASNLPPRHTTIYSDSANINELTSVPDLDPNQDPRVFCIPDPDPLVRYMDPDPHQNVMDPEHDSSF